MNIPTQGRSRLPACRDKPHPVLKVMDPFPSLSRPLTVTRPWREPVSLDEEEIKDLQTVREYCMLLHRAANVNLCSNVESQRRIEIKESIAGKPAKLVAYS